MALYLSKPWINKYCNQELDKLLLKFGNHQFDSECVSVEEFIQFDWINIKPFRAQIVKVLSCPGPKHPEAKYMIEISDNQSSILASIPDHVMENFTEDRKMYTGLIGALICVKCFRFDLVPTIQNGIESLQVQLLFEDFGFAGLEGAGIIGEFKLINSVKQVYDKLRRLSGWISAYRTDYEKYKKDNENNNQQIAKEEYKTNDVDLNINDNMECQKFETEPNHEDYRTNNVDLDINDNAEHQMFETKPNHEEYQTNNADFDVNDNMECNETEPNHESEENVDNVEYDLFTQAPVPISIFPKNNLQKDFDNSACIEKSDHPGWGHSYHLPSYLQTIIPEDQQNTLKDLSWRNLQLNDRSPEPEQFPTESLSVDGHGDIFQEMIGVATQETGLLMEEDGAFDKYLGMSAGSILKLEESENINLSNEEFIDAQDFVQDQMDELVNGFMRGDFTSLDENEAEVAALAKFMDSSEEDEEDYFEENDSVSSTSGSRKGEIERNFHEFDNIDFEFDDKSAVQETMNDCTKKSMDEAKVDNDSTEKRVNDSVDNENTKNSVDDTEAVHIDHKDQFIDETKAACTDHKDQFIDETKSACIDNIEKTMDETEAACIDNIEKTMDASEAACIDNTNQLMDETEAACIDNIDQLMDETEAACIDHTNQLMDETEAACIDNRDQLMDETEVACIDHKNQLIKPTDQNEAACIDFKDKSMDETDTAMEKQESALLPASEMNMGVNPAWGDISDSVTEQSQTETEDQIETNEVIEKQEPALLPASEMNVLEMLGVNPAWGDKISICDSVSEQSQTETDDEESIYTQDDSDEIGRDQDHHTIEENLIEPEGEMDIASSQASTSSNESIEDSVNDIFPENIVMDSEEELNSFFVKKDTSDDDIFQGNLLDELATEKDIIHEKENISQQFDQKPNVQKLSDIYARHTKLDLFSENPGLSSPAVPGTYITPQKVRCDKSEDRANDSPDTFKSINISNQKRRIQLPTNIQVMIPKVTIEISSKMNRQQPAQLLIHQESSTVDNDGSRTPKTLKRKNLFGEFLSSRRAGSLFSVQPPGKRNSLPNIKRQTEMLGKKMKRSKYE